MTESQRTTSEQERPRNLETDPRVGQSDMQRSTSSSNVGVYDDQDKPTNTSSTTTSSTTTSTTTSSSGNMMWIILLIVLIIVAFFILRQWM